MYLKIFLQTDLLKNQVKIKTFSIQKLNIAKTKIEL